MSAIARRFRPMRPRAEPEGERTALGSEVPGSRPGLAKTYPSLAHVLRTRA